MNDCRVHCRTNLEVIRLLEPLYLKGGTEMSTASKKRRGLYALLTMIVASWVMITAAGQASADTGLTASVVAASASADNTVTVEVEVIEPMGAECVLYVNCGGDDMVVNLDSATGAKERQPLEVVFDMAKCHVFDQETEVTII